MFSFLKKKEKSFEFTPEVEKTAIESVNEVKRQYADYFRGVEINLLPDIGAIHAYSTTAYIQGFVSGMFQENQSHMKMANGDQELAYQIWMSIIDAAVTILFGEDRAKHLLEVIIAENRDMSPAWEQLEQYGGADGIAHAHGEEKQEGGLLLHYLRFNVEQE